MLHNLAHVELNAIDLAWDTVARFSPFFDVLGRNFFDDFAHVADDESRHFLWCSQRLAELGFKSVRFQSFKLLIGICFKNLTFMIFLFFSRYGDIPANNLLMRECEKTSNNVAARLAVIPLVQVVSHSSNTHGITLYFTGDTNLFKPDNSIIHTNLVIQEARGLDAGPRLVKRLTGFGDNRTSKIVAKIAEEEVAHVAVGVDWFLSVCRKMNRAPSPTFRGIDKSSFPCSFFTNVINILSTTCLVQI